MASIKSLPNILSASRGAVAPMLLVVSFGSPLFWAAYLWCGASDMVDGPLARRLGACSSRGAAIDSVADFIFVVAACAAILPQLAIPVWMWICIGLIALVKFVNLVSGLVCHHRVVFLHTTANKLTGLLLFLLPISLNWVSITIDGPCVIAVALFAAIQEGHFIRIGHQA